MYQKKNNFSYFYSIVDFNHYILRRSLKKIVFLNSTKNTEKFYIRSWKEKWSDDKREFISNSSVIIAEICLACQEEYEYILSEYECIQIHDLRGVGIKFTINGDICEVQLHEDTPNSTISQKLTSYSYDFLGAALDDREKYPLMELFRDQYLQKITNASDSKEAISFFYSKMQRCFDTFQNRELRTDKYNIPRIVHYVWLSDNAFDKKQGIPPNFKRPHAAHIECFKDNVSVLSKEKGWKHVIWTNIPKENSVLVNAFKTALRLSDDVELKTWDETLQFSSPALMLALNEMKNYAMASDILRYHVLFKKGGVYCDFDFNFLIDPDYLLKKSCFFAGLDRSRSIAPTNAVIGAKRYHPILKKCIDEIERSFVNELLTIIAHHKENVVKTTLDYTGPFLLGKAYYQAANEATDVLLPPYSFSWNFYVHENPNRVYDWGQLHSFAIGRHAQSESWFNKVKQK